MDFGISEDQVLLKDSVRKFLETECPTTRVRTIMESDTGHDPELWQGIEAIVVRNEPGKAWVSEDRWRGLTSRTRAAVAQWSSRCTSSGTPLALVGSPSGDILGHYSLEKGLAYTP